MSYMKDFMWEIGVMYKQGASVERIAAHLDTTEEQVEAAIDMLMDDPDFRDDGDFDEPEPLYDIEDEPLSADDAAYALASAGWGTDEDYGADFHDGEFA